MTKYDCFVMSSIIKLLFVLFNYFYACVISEFFSLAIIFYDVSFLAHHFHIQLKCNHFDLVVMNEFQKLMY